MINLFFLYNVVFDYKNPTVLYPFIQGGLYYNEHSYIYKLVELI